MTVGAYRRYLLVLLTTLLAFNTTDQYAVGMALQSIKQDLHLNDTELGFLGGIAFFLFYAAFGVPMGRWADRGNRVTILALTRILWGAFVMLTGRATSFLGLLTFRMGVAVGESGCLPPAFSLISDYFPRKERPQAIGVFFLAVPVASVLTYLCAGWLIQLYGWRTMFAVLGTSGFVLAPLTWATLHEPRARKAAPAAPPRDGRAVPHSADSSRVMPVSEAYGVLYRNVTYRNLLLVLVVDYLFSSGIAQWQPAFLIRTYGLGAGAMGTWLAVVYGVSGLIGTYLGGKLASRLAGGNERAQLLSLAVVSCLPAILFPIVYLSRSACGALVLLGLANVPFGLGTAPLFATLQCIVPSRLRGMSIMIVYFFANLIGSGIGPLIVGALSDATRPLFGADSLRYALLAISPWFLLAGWFAWRAGRTVERDLDAIREETDDSLDALEAAVSRQS